MPVDYQETYSSPNFEVRDVNGLLANAGTVTATITLPDLTIKSSPADFTVNNPSTGIYNFDYLTTQAGRHLVVVSATGGTLGSLVRKFVDAFVVRPADPTQIISLATAKEVLDERDTTHDEEIRAYIEVATAIIESISGPTATRIYTERVRNGTWVLKLANKPVQSVTSITSIPTPSTTYLTAELDVDGAYGHIYRLNGQWFSDGPWTAVYKAGQTTALQIHAVKEQLWHMWAKQRGQTRDTDEPDLVDVADYESRAFGFGFLVPRDVMQLFDNDLIPGVA